MPRQFVVQVNNQPGQMANARRADGRARRRPARDRRRRHRRPRPHDHDHRGRRHRAEGPRGRGLDFFEGESLLVEVDDRPGGMAKLARELADAGVNVHGHLFMGRWSDRATFAFVVDDPEKARPILERR